MESLCGLHTVRAGLHPGGGLHHLPLLGLYIVRGDPGLPGRLHRSNAGDAAAPPQLSEQIHRGHEVPIQSLKILAFVIGQFVNGIILLSSFLGAFHISVPLLCLPTANQMAFKTKLTAPVINVFILMSATAITGSSEELFFSKTPFRL